MAVATIRDLTVRYGSFTALKGLTCTVPEGCTGLLGPNGAGKTTLLKTLLGFVEPAGGLHRDPRAARRGREIRQQVGLMPEQDCHIPGMSAVQFVAYAGELAGMPKDQAIDRAAQGPALRGAGRGAVPERGDLLDGHEAAAKAGPGPRPRPEAAAARRADERARPAGARGDAGPRPRREPRQGHPRPRVVAPPARHRADLRPGDRRDGRARCGRRTPSRTSSGWTRPSWTSSFASPSCCFPRRRRGRGWSWSPSTGASTASRARAPRDAIQRAALEAARETGAQVRGYTAAERSLEEAFIQAVSDARRSAWAT